MVSSALGAHRARTVDAHVSGGSAFAAAAAAFLALAPLALAQTQSTADPDRPVTPPDSYRVVMENERVRIIEIHIKARSKVNVDLPANRDRFLYMLSDGALVLAPPGKKPYEFALQAGETAVFPAVSPTVENDTDLPVRALMVEVKTPVRTAAMSGKPAKAQGRPSGQGGQAHQGGQGERRLEEIGEVEVGPVGEADDEAGQEAAQARTRRGEGGAQAAQPAEGEREAHRSASPARAKAATARAFPCRVDAGSPQEMRRDRYS